MARVVRGSWLWVALCLLLFARVSAHDVGSELALLTTDSAGDTTSADEGPVVRCRMCGATVALKKDYMPLHDTSKSVSARHASNLGENGGDVHTFVNPSRVELELVAFKKALGVEGEAFTNKATFFEGYNWRDLRCGGCNRHIGWKFRHDDLQQCIHTRVMESVSAKAQEELKSATTEEIEKKRARVHKELEGQCVTATAGWWSYQVCYKKEVRQYHEEPDGTRPSEWSMGVFSADSESRGEEQLNMGTDIVHYFTGGQHCDENGELRNSKVVYTCCKSRPKVATIENVEEPSLCSYLITVCVPSLCSKTSKADSANDYKLIGDECENEFQHEHEDAAIPASFAALRWSTVISEDSSELDWARSMQFKA